MKYRKFGKYDIKLSALGFGCMRLPILNDDPSKIDEENATKMLRYAIDNGLNYVDTAYPYHQGNSEYFVGRALKDGYREKVYLATKNPVWLANKYEDFEKYLDEQLKKLDTEYIDMYLLHSLNKERWDKISNLKVLNFLDEAKEKGKIKFAGFSFHDDFKTFKKIVDSYNWDFCQIQYNYLDTHFQAGIAGLKYAKRKGLAVVIMEPIRGGKLANKLPQEAVDILSDLDKTKSPAYWALRWVWNHPEVTTVLSGMSTMDQVIENLKAADDSDPNSLSERELKTIEQVRNIYKSKSKIDCTGCNYCVPCKNGIPIPTIFSIYNEGYIFDNLLEAKERYQSLIKQGIDASICEECGDCEEECPQHLPIRMLLKQVKNELT
ncbi:MULTISPECIES: aldo/keto reductase [Petrotoga]|uniref:4Fe-4S ferredoxin-type domain-containing protein n=2 Tax=Petrotoga sibirica TaxID=156202 RepID=A0A4R8F4K8_9BACT|nr:MULTISPECIES: aldo/keto reductase [Petrotoga]POZ88021.1 aldo/keto reductase [Petrotoga sibirica DSM 13575]POZ90111.1 aldo/keto reductase [Petrotoga sp. SL27]TDX17111.1 hypothetical protein C8D74_10255 [Petrotoga sibirica]